jgi:hypothetical protein
MPSSKQLPLQGRQLGADLRASALPLGDGLQIEDQMGITELALAGGQVVVGGVAVAHQLHFAATQGDGTGEQAHPTTELGPVATGLHIRRQWCAGAGGATGAHQPVQPMLDHNQGERRNLDHPLAQGIWILTPQQGAAAATGIRAVPERLIHSSGSNSVPLPGWPGWPPRSR